ncbi:AMP-dependent synthetase/ligase [Nocardioides albus]|uniref:Acyl-CoA synthetase n=1 Tax=Nocardioides albus TaxID=1841 RepID=A0A7W5A7Q5_9ACTN|nr:long-chain fatty acid--CoA ligase [Nocardioides albus]MBB3090949.1 long-chain acyl-CoA synthetase [Nocardioides albus]GGU38564.1 AMP-dependent synthetase [Nocardioides albus]
MPTQSATDLAFLDEMPANFALHFLNRVKATPNAEAFRYPVVGSTTEAGGEEWKSLTWKEASDLAGRLAAGLVSLGLELEQRVGIASTTRYEWIIADLAVMLAGGATTTVYPTTNVEDTAYILGDAECRFVFAEDDGQLAKIAERAAELPEIVKVITFDGATDGDRVIGLDDLAALGDKHLADHPGLIDEIAAKITADHLATLVYTSGTTGKPKGVRLLHRAWVYEGEAVRVADVLGPDDLQFLWLPMSHVFGKVLLSIQIACGFPTAIDGRMDKIVDNLGIVKPTFMGAAPRIFEKVHSKITMMVESDGGVKKKLFDAAFANGIARDRLLREGKSVPTGMALKHAVLDKLVLSKVRDRFGGRVRFFISGSAPLNRDIAEWFRAAGILIMEGYGSTENAAGAAVGTLKENKLGTVGKAFPGSEVKIGDNDELLIRGPHIMPGYHNLPEETAKALDADGWYHTGDKASIDEDGYITITGRIKELFKTSGGKYVAPPAIESKFAALCPYSSQFLVFGANRNFVTALITLDPESITAWGASHGLEGKSYEEIVTSPQVRELIGGYVDELNAGLNRWETIKKWEILEHDLTVESGELTPSLKVKRKVVEEKEQARIDAFYAG